MMEGNEHKQAEEPKVSLDGLQGWLLLVGLGVLIAPVKLILSSIPIYTDLFTNSGWEAISTPSSEYYSPGIMAFIGFEALFNIAMLLATIYLVYLFFAKHRRFPKLYIAVVVVTILMIPLDASIGSLLMPDENMWDATTTRDFIRALMTGVIWIPYMLVSKRVKATFRHPDKTRDAAEVETTGNNS